MEIHFKVKGDLWKDSFCVEADDISSEGQALMNEVYRSKPLFGGKSLDTPLAEDRIKVRLLRRKKGRFE